MTQVESYSPRRARRASHSSSPLTPSDPPGRPSPYAPAVPVDPGTLRGRHSTTLGQGFSWVIGWTVVGFLLPGAGLAAAGWRKLGAFLLFLQLAAIVALAGLVLTGNPLREAIGVATDSDKLLVVAASAVALAVLWILFLLITNTSLRRYAVLTGGQKAFSGLVMLALVAGIALPAYKVADSALLTRGVLGTVLGDDSEANSAIKEKAVDPWADKPRMNVLLIGSDAGADRVGIRPDTLVLASIDTKSGNTVLFSLPRNLGHAPFPAGSPGARRWPNGYWCPNPTTGLNDCLINAVWQWGESAEGKTYYTGKHPGLKATEDAVRGVTGLPVDSYVMLNLKGFQQFVDAIGGIRMDVKERLPIGGNSENPVAVGGWIEKAKNKKLDGYHALWYARSRWSTSDYDRMRRQRCVIAAAVSQASPTELALNFNKIAKTLKQNLSTGIAQSQIQAWVDLSLRVQKAKVYSLPFTDQVLSNRDNPDFADIQSLVQKAIKRSTASSTPSASASAGATPGASPSATKAPSKSANANPLKAQDVKAVC